jgi:hypothetical protein
VKKSTAEMRMSSDSPEAAQPISQSRTIAATNWEDENEDEEDGTGVGVGVQKKRQLDSSSLGLYVFVVWNSEALQGVLWIGLLQQVHC